MRLRLFGSLLVAGASLLASAEPQSAPLKKISGIPLCVGLQIVTAINQADGDYESIKTIEAVDGEKVRIKYSSERLVTDFLAEDFGKVKKSTIYRTVRRADIANAGFYAQRYFDDMPETIPDSTAIGVSAKVLKALKTTGKAELSYSNAYAGDPPVDRKQSPNIYDFATPGELTRAGVRPVTVLVDNQLAELPAVQAKGDFASEPAEFVLLDDPSNPLALSFRIGIGSVAPMVKEMVEECQEVAKVAPDMAKMLCRAGKEPTDTETLKVVKINHACAPPPTPAAAPAPPPAAQQVSELSRELASNQKVAVYDLYFDFNSDKIKPESEPRLKEIADVMAANPAWRLSVSGHTDSVASDAFNLDLSKRRAAAVKAALVSRYKVDAKRLESSGFGEAQPRATNDTIEGRAQNRRVELQKL